MDGAHEHGLNTFLFAHIYPTSPWCVPRREAFIRFDASRYTWKSDSRTFAPRQLRLGSNLFHIGILGIFFAFRRAADAPSPSGTRWAWKRRAIADAGGFVAGRSLRHHHADRHHRPHPPAPHRAAHPARTPRRRLAGAGGCCSPSSRSAAVAGGVLRASRRRRDDQADDVGAAHRDVPGRRPPAFVTDVAPWCSRLHLLLGMTIFLVVPVHPAGARLERLSRRGLPDARPTRSCADAEPGPPETRP